MWCEQYEEISINRQVSINKIWRMCNVNWCMLQRKICSSSKSKKCTIIHKFVHLLYSGLLFHSTPFCSQTKFLDICICKWGLITNPAVRRCVGDVRTPFLFFSYIRVRDLSPTKTNLKIYNKQKNKRVNVKLFRSQFKTNASVKYL